MTSNTWNTSTLRPASKVPAPWKDELVNIVLISGQEVRQACTLDGKRLLLDKAKRSDLLLLAWPGKWSQDVFVIDDIQAAREALM